MALLVCASKAICGLGEIHQKEGLYRTMD